MKRHFKSAIKGLWINRWSTLIAILCIGICFFIITGVFLMLYNLELFTKKLSTKAAIVIYLKEGMGQSEITGLMEKLKKMGVFFKLQYISKDDALKEMKNFIDPGLIEMIGYNPLFDTLEAFLKEEYLQGIEGIVKNIKSFEYVEDVYYPAKIISGLKIIRVTVWNFGLVIFFLLLLAVLFIIYATVKSLYWKKTEDIEILKLLGATPSYIRMPFLIEGGILGLGGAIFAGVFMISLYFIMQTKNISEFLPAVSRIVFPVEIFYILPLCGIVLGMLSSFFALGRIKYN